MSIRPLISVDRVLVLSSLSIFTHQLLYEVGTGLKLMHEARSLFAEITHHQRVYLTLRLLYYVQCVHALVRHLSRFLSEQVEF